MDLPLFLGETVFQFGSSSVRKAFRDGVAETGLPRSCEFV